MQVNGTTYYYVTNLQGDVMGLVDTSGNSVASYTYDPYGKVLTATGALAEKNPLRYRGYYYDFESGLYYLQSRYYDPATRRFINADSYASTGQGLIGHNMFAYCNNDPGNSIDPYGYGSISIGGTSRNNFCELLDGGCSGGAGGGGVAIGILLGLEKFGTAVANGAKKAYEDIAYAVSKPLAGGIVEATSQADDTKGRTYAVYFWEDQFGIIRYVGRVTDDGFRQRMNYHRNTRGLEEVYSVHGLTKDVAHGLEEIGMIQCHTINSLNSLNNQIHGIAWSNARGETYLQAAYAYLDNRAEQALLNLLS